MKKKEIIDMYKKEGYYIINEYPNKSKRIKYIIKKDGYLFLSNPKDFKSGVRPNIVDNRNPYSIQNIYNFIKINKIESILLSDEYINNKTKLKFKCKCGNIYIADWTHFRNNHNWNCIDCTVKRTHNLQKHKMEDVKQKLLNNGLEPLFDNYSHSHDFLPVKNKEGYKIMITYVNIGKVNGELKFHKSNQFTIDNIKHFLKINYINIELMSKEYKGLKSKLKFKCSCGKMFYTDLHSLLYNDKRRCDKCSRTQSSLELMVEKYLINNNIKYISEYRFKDCKDKRPLPFDFYLPELNYCIEADGIYHYKIVKHTKETHLENQQIRDEIKNKYCKDNNIQLLRIPYWEFRNGNYINILNNFLKE